MCPALPSGVSQTQPPPPTSWRALTGPIATLIGDGPARRAPTAEVAFAIAVLVVIALFVIPLPAVLLDLGIALSIGLSLVVLLVALQATDPLDFSSFPQLLLLLTLYRLVLNVASTRLILSDGHAGAIIQAFGNFVIGGNYAVGLILFLILITINFIVITKGSGRVAEVSARFVLDAMPGKQMAIDAQLNAGHIDHVEAERKRERITRHADFYAGMDGASKFVKGDAIAGLLITAVNIIGGFFIGVIQKGLPFGEALAKFTVLSVGDGLVTQVPALIISTAAGIMVTHAGGEDRMGVTVATQLGAQSKPMYLSAGVLALFAVIPGLPAIPFLVLGAGLFLVGRAAQRSEEKRRTAAQVAEHAPPAPPADPLEDLLQTDTIELDVGFGLVSLVQEQSGGHLMEKLALLRKQAGLELGILMPAVRTRDNAGLAANGYVIRFRGTEVARGEVLPRFFLAVDTGHTSGIVDGIDTVDPSFGMRAKWIAGNRKSDAEALGYVVVDATTVITTHLLEVLKAHAAEVLGRQDVQEVLNTLKKTHPALVEEVVPAKLSLGVVHRVVQRLLRERVPIRDLVTILESIGDAADSTKDPELLTEHARRALGPVIARQFADESGTVYAITVGPRLEQALSSLFSPRPGQVSAPLGPDVLPNLIGQLAELSTHHGSVGRPAPLIVPSHLRLHMRRMLDPVFPQVPVLSLAELPPSVEISKVASWEMPAQVVAA